MIDTKTFLQTLDARIDAHKMLNHPFYQTWNMGKLTRDALEGFAQNGLSLGSVLLLVALGSPGSESTQPCYAEHLPSVQPWFCLTMAEYRQQTVCGRFVRIRMSKCSVSLPKPPQGCQQPLQPVTILIGFKQL